MLLPKPRSIPVVNNAPLSSTSALGCLLLLPLVVAIQKNFGGSAFGCASLDKLRTGKDRQSRRPGSIRSAVPPEAGKHPRLIADHSHPQITQIGQITEQAGAPLRSVTIGVDPRLSSIPLSAFLGLRSCAAQPRVAE